jgi:hypothetical protein
VCIQLSVRCSITFALKEQPMSDLPNETLEADDPNSSSASPSETSSLEARFKQLVEQWRSETGMYSSITRKVQHPAYRKLIEMGKDALPFILRELCDRPAHWFTALQAIVQDDSIGKTKDPRTAREAWLKWGKERGLI